ncbi:MAG: hypothetical protein R3F21_25970 [Myxococcota bacterium]
MPVLPLIDLLLLSGWTSLLVGFVLKVVYLTTSYRPTLLSLAPRDFLEIAIAAMLFAIALAARTWVKDQEPTASAMRRRDETLAAWTKLSATEAGAVELASARDLGRSDVRG